MATVFERLTDQARSVVWRAQEEAIGLNHLYIGTEHILLALLIETNTVAAEVLGSFNISAEAVRSQVEEIIGRGSKAPRARIPFTPHAKQVWHLSMSESLQLGQLHIGTEHILLGLLDLGEGVASQVLENLGADSIRLGETVIDTLKSLPP